MYSYPIESWKQLKKNQVKDGIYLWITHADKIPPHIGISVDGNYFSLKVNGKDDLDTQVILRSINSKKIPSLLIQIDKKTISPERFLTVKNTYDTVNPGISTCMTPICGLFFDETKSLLLAEFLHFLSGEEMIVEYFGLNLPENFQGILAYDSLQVNKHLNELKHAERNKHISETH